MFGSAIKKYIDSMDIERSAVACKLGVSLDDFCEMLEGSRPISAEQYHSICSILGVSVNFFAEKFSA